MQKAFFTRAAHTLIPLALGVVVGLCIYPLFMNEWVLQKREPRQGVLVHGDRSAPPARWQDGYIAPRYAKYAVIGVPPEAAYRGYSVGFMAFNRQSFIQKKICHDPQFRMRVGREDLKIYAVSRSGEELTVSLIALCGRDEREYAYAPIH
jgi:hypothetical protein